jgi:hypothetical protein
MLGGNHHRKEGGMKPHSPNENIQRSRLYLKERTRERRLINILCKPQ